MDFLNIIQLVIDVQQYPESHKEEIERLKNECKLLSNLIHMIGEDQLPNDLQSQIAKNLEEAEELLKKVPRKAGMLQSFINLLPGQQVVPKLKEASDNIHRTSNNLNTWLNCRIYSSKIEQKEDSNDMRVSKVKRMNSGDQQPLLQILQAPSNGEAGEKGQIPSTLVDPLGPTYQNDSDQEDEKDLFGGEDKKKKKRAEIILELEDNGDVLQKFEQLRINTREEFLLPLQNKVFFCFQRQTYHLLSEQIKDVNRISRDHATLELLNLCENDSKDNEHKETAKIQEKQALKTENEEEQFATCVEEFSDKEGDDCFEKDKSTSIKEKIMCCIIECKGPNGIMVYRKRDNQTKQDELQKQHELPKLKTIPAGSWVDVKKGEKALIFNNDSFALLKKETITISYAFHYKEIEVD